MSKLTTERLEYYAALPTQPAEGDGFFKKGIFMYEVRRMARQLLAYEQAAKNPIGSFHISGGQVEATTDYCRDGEWPVQDGEVLVYAAPVLPKQPDVTLTNEGDITKIVKAAEKLVRCKGRYHSEQNYRALAALFGVTVPDLPPLPSDEAPAQSEPLMGTVVSIDDASGLEGHRQWGEVVGLSESHGKPVICVEVTGYQYD